MLICFLFNTLKEHQKTLTNATVSKDSDMVFITMVCDEINILNDGVKLRTFVYKMILKKYTS